PVSFLIKVPEKLRAPAGKKHFSRIAGVRPLKRLIQQSRKIDRGIRADGLDRPTGYRVAAGLDLLRKRRPVESVKLVIETGNQFQIVGQSAQLGGTAQLQLHSVVQIET